LKSIQAILQRGLGVLSAVTNSLVHFSGRKDQSKEIVEFLVAQGKRVDI
jgi:hypothetical protein